MVIQSVGGWIGREEIMLLCILVNGAGHAYASIEKWLIVLRENRVDFDKRLIILIIVDVVDETRWVVHQTHSELVEKFAEVLARVDVSYYQKTPFLVEVFHQLLDVELAAAALAQTHQYYQRVFMLLVLLYLQIAIADALHLQTILGV